MIMSSVLYTCSERIVGWSFIRASRGVAGVVCLLRASVECDFEFVGRLAFELLLTVGALLADFNLYSSCHDILEAIRMAREKQTALFQSVASQILMEIHGSTLRQMQSHSQLHKLPEASLQAGVLSNT